jgi:diguanylate cyclase (GGDEF)-like protein/hemerythrin-like metal-binding protein
MGIVATFLVLQRQLGAESRLARKHREAEGRAREMARKADTDALTGVANRQGFNEAIAREFARGRRFHHPLSVILVDLDHFKRVNDRFGHAVGDQVLVATARLLSTRVRVSDLVARWGGEEFVIIASTTNAAGAARLAEKLRALLEAAPAGPAGTLTASFGVAEMRLDDTVETMLRRADEALYEAKAKGRNQVRCAESWVDMAAVTAGAAEAPEGGGRAAHMETGFAPVDEEHRALTAAIADFAGLVTRGDEARTKDAMPVLIGRIAEHFAAEDSLMRRCAYPARSRHEEAHVLFVADMKRFQLELERGGLTPGFLQWATARLPEWFRYHILAHDVALGKFLVAQGPGAAGARREA